MMDKYDVTIAILEHASKIVDDETFGKIVHSVWENCVPPFQVCTPNGKMQYPFGCLTQVKKGIDCHGIQCRAWNDEMTKRIKADPYVPMDVSEINKGNFLEILGHMAMIQRGIDNEIRQTT